MSNEKLYNENKTAFVYIDNVLGIKILHEGYRQRDYVNLDILRVVAILKGNDEFTLDKPHVEFEKQESVLKEWSNRLDEARSKSIQIPTLAELGIDYEKELERMRAELKNETTGVPDKEA